MGLIQIASCLAYLSQFIAHPPEAVEVRGIILIQCDGGFTLLQSLLKIQVGLSKNIS